MRILLSVTPISKPPRRVSSQPAPAAPMTAHRAMIPRGGSTKIIFMQTSTLIPTKIQVMVVALICATP